MKDWKTIEAWPRYEVSKTGQVRNSETGHTLKTRPDKDGYRIATLSIQGRRLTAKVHRLVAEAFVLNPNQKPCVNHINGDKTDNRAENLEWCTPGENILHSYRVLARKSTHAEGCGRPKRRVLCEDTGEVFESAMDAARAVAGQQGPLSAVCRGERPTYKGKRWRYVS